MSVVKNLVQDKESIRICQGMAQTGLMLDGCMKLSLIILCFERDLGCVHVRGCHSIVDELETRKGSRIGISYVTNTLGGMSWCGSAGGPVAEIAELHQNEKLLHTVERWLRAERETRPKEVPSEPRSAPAFANRHMAFYR